MYIFHLLCYLLTLLVAKAQVDLHLPMVQKNKLFNYFLTLLVQTYIEGAQKKRLIEMILESWS